MRRQGMSRSGACAIGFLVLLCGAPLAAEEAAAPRPEQPKKQYRWGVGWDEGLAFRARLPHGFGLGLRLNPNLVHPESADTSSSREQASENCNGAQTCTGTQKSDSTASSTGDQRTLSGALMVYHETKLGKWLAVGPYLAANYQRTTDTTTDTSQGNATTQYNYPYLRVQPLPEVIGATDNTKTQTWKRTVGIEIGVRPTFQFHDRFVLETRFGLELAFTRWNETTTSQSARTDNGGTPANVLPASYTDTSSGTRTSSGSDHRFHTVGERLGPGAQLRFVVLF
jgi:hypothetical protein